MRKLGILGYGIMILSLIGISLCAAGFKRKID